MQPNLLGINDAKTPPHRGPARCPASCLFSGFVCSSDPNATSGQFPAPISYRACTGDSPAGENGAFRPGRVISLQEIQDRDGLSFTAAFSERLVGDNLCEPRRGLQLHDPDGPLASGRVPAVAGRCRAGAEMRDRRGFGRIIARLSTTTPCPRAASLRASTAAAAAAFMGASSGHVQGVNLLFLDGRVTVVRPSIDPKIWKEFARIGPPETDSPGQ